MRPELVTEKTVVEAEFVTSKERVRAEVSEPQRVSFAKGVVVPKAVLPET